MATQSEVMHCYEQAASLTDQMLSLVRDGQWGALPALESRYSEAVERLQVIEPLLPLSQAQSERKHHLLGRIIPNYNELNDIVTPELARLGEALRTLEQQQNLHSAYSQFQ